MSIDRYNQCDIAKRWLKRGDDTKDIFAQFFFYFTGFNAMYIIDKEKLTKIIKKEPRERELIENLLAKFNKKSQEIIEKIKLSIEYFGFTHNPIINMNNDKTSWGETNQKTLRNNEKSEKVAEEKIIALGQIIYTVRCNLYHGSKDVSGDDIEIVENCIEPLKVFLKEALDNI